MRRSLGIILNFPSMHLKYLFDELSKDFDIKFLVYDNNAFAERNRQGWSVYDVNPDDFITDADEFEIDNYHAVLCLGLKALRIANRLAKGERRISIFYIAEPPIFYNNVQFFIKLIYYWFFLKVTKNVDLKRIFAIGTIGVCFYKKIFKNVTPFMYFVDPKKIYNDRKDRNLINERYLYVGSLSFRKNIDLLVKTVGYHDLRLDIYSVDKFTTNERIRYCGNIDNGFLINYLMASYKSLFLLSRFDGWGMVCSESLCSGVPIIISRMVGARMLKVFYPQAVTFIDSLGELKPITTNDFDCKKLYSIQNKFLNKLRFYIDENID